MKDILVALDFSTSTQPVIDAACRLGRLEGATLHLLHVVEPIPEFVGYDAAGVIPAVGSDPLPVQTKATSSERRLNDLVESIQARGVRADYELVEGLPVDCVLEKARALSVGMIIMGSHGHGALYHLLVGSVTEGVLKHAPCPVLVVPLPREG